MQFALETCTITPNRTQEIMGQTVLVSKMEIRCHGNSKILQYCFSSVDQYPLTLNDKMSSTCPPPHQSLSPYLLWGTSVDHYPREVDSTKL